MTYACVYVGTYLSKIGLYLLMYDTKGLEICHFKLYRHIASTCLQIMQIYLKSSNVLLYKILMSELRKWAQETFDE